MKVYLKPDVDSRGINRVYDALVKYKPANVEVVDDPTLADFEVIHVWGRHDRVERRIERLLAQGKSYAMIQYSIRSTRNPSTHDWVDMWRKSKVVWSYYDLNELAHEDRNISNFPFYYAPLGVDTEVFNVFKYQGTPIYPQYVVHASSQGYLVESARECVLATKIVGKKMFYSGQELNMGPNIVCKTGLTDKELAEVYSQCQFVSGLRRVEGFELPVIEGFACGARPIVFDKPHYRHWFDGLAEFIPESSREDVINNLVGLFGHIIRVNPDYNPTVVNQICEERFNWSKIIKGFYDYL